MEKLFYLECLVMLPNIKGTQNKLYEIYWYEGNWSASGITYMSYSNALAKIECFENNLKDMIKIREKQYN